MPATSFGKIVSVDQVDSWERSVQGTVEPPKSCEQIRNRYSLNTSRIRWMTLLFRRVRNGDTRLRSVGAMPKTQEAVVGRRWRQGCIDGLASDCWLVRRISEVNFSTYGLALLTEVGQCTVVSVSDLGYYPVTPVRSLTLLTSSLLRFH